MVKASAIWWKIVFIVDLIMLNGPLFVGYNYRIGEKLMADVTSLGDAGINCSGTRDGQSSVFYAKPN